MAIASFISISSPHLPYRTSLTPPPPPSQFKNASSWRVKCAPSGDTDPDSETTSSSSSSALLGSTYKWCATLGGVGLVETAYLSYLKLTDADAFCPVGGAGSCGDVLNSDYAVVFGVPLPLIGMVAYGLVASLGVLLPRNNLPFGITESYGRFILLGCITSMAAASGYFLYILSTKFSGATCVYCLISALLSFTLFFLTLKDFGFQEIQKTLALQLCAAGLVIATLSTSYGSLLPVSARSQGEVELPYFTTEITTSSSPFAISLARHLHSIGAKMYGAFWCSHCLEQKEMFGKEASKLLDYVECFPEGYRKGIKIAKACADAKLEGFPTWVINGETLSGELELAELARVSGFELKDDSQSS